jgi:hypothetical protein
VNDEELEMAQKTKETDFKEEIHEVFKAVLLAAEVAVRNDSSGR